MRDAALDAKRSNSTAIASICNDAMRPHDMAGTDQFQ